MLLAEGECKKADGNEPSALQHSTLAEITRSMYTKFQLSTVHKTLIDICSKQHIFMFCGAPAGCMCATLAVQQHLSGHALHLWLHSLQEARPEAVVVSTLREALKHGGPKPEATAA